MNFTKEWMKTEDNREQKRWVLKAANISFAHY